MLKLTLLLIKLTMLAEAAEAKAAEPDDTSQSRQYNMFPASGCRRFACAGNGDKVYSIPGSFIALGCCIFSN
jgi:hypothetical protein